MLKNIFAKPATPKQQDDWLTRIETDPAFCEMCLKALQNLRLERDRHNDLLPKSMRQSTDDSAIMTLLKAQVTAQMHLNNLTDYQASEIVLQHHANRKVGYPSPDDVNRHIATVHRLHAANPTHKLAQISALLYHTPKLVNKYA